MKRDELLKKIMALSFVRDECVLYLDTHPDCAAALQYYREAGEELRRLRDAYEGEFGPLTADGVRGETWSWVSGPWPWQNADGGVRQ